ncbi:glycosyltransferase [Patescibacteria group bacterium]|nr:glycosyltransferase [Patescibacteria group bacterium]
MKVLYFATYYTKHYVRQDVIRRALSQIQDIEVVECVYNRKSVTRYIQALWKFVVLPKKDIDIIIVGFRGHEILPIMRLLTKKPIIFDAFISIYDTLCFDRKKYSSSSVIGRMAYWLDRYCCRTADGILLDTKAHINYFVNTFNIPKEKFFNVPVGADKKIFYPRNQVEKKSKFIVFYYGTALPLQGIATILEAAKILEYESNILFKLIGPIRKKFKDEINQLDLKNVEFVDWVPYQQLPEEIMKADVCLGGHFSSVNKARRVISGKTFQFLAMGKPVVVGRNRANEELLKDREDCLMVKMTDAGDLARAIMELKTNEALREQVSKRGYQKFLFIQKSIESSLRNLLFKHFK